MGEAECILPFSALEIPLTELPLRRQPPGGPPKKVHHPMRHPLRNRSLAAWLAFAALAALAACSDAGVNPAGPDAKKQPKPTTPPPVDTTTTTPTRPFYAGAYLGSESSTPQTIAAAIGSFGTLTGRQPSLVKTFHSLN